MTALLGLLIIVAVSYLGSVYIFSKEKLPTPVRYLFYSGWEFILLGLAVGPLALDLFPPQVIAQMDPLLQLGLGWIGLFIGLQLKTKDLARVHLPLLSVTLLQALLTGMVIFAMLYPLKDIFLPWDSNLDLLALLILSASATLSSPTVVSLLRKETGFRERVITLLRVITNLDGVVAIVAVGIAFTVFRPGVDITDGLFLLVQGIVAGLILAYLFYMMPRKTFTENETVVILIGFVLFSSGIGSILQVSPLFLNLVCGIFLANVLPPKDTFYAAITDLERPLYIVMLIIAGLYFVNPPTEALLVALLIVFVRLVVKYMAISRLSPLINPHLKFPPGSGFALASQGAMALVVGFAFISAYPSETSQRIFSLIVICVTANEIIAPYLVAMVMKKGEG